MKRIRIFILDPMSGSGTSQDVAEELHIPSVLYDLNPHPPKGIGNWNALKDEVAHSADLIFSTHLTMILSGIPEICGAGRMKMI